MQITYERKVAIVTGASRGIGQATAAALLAAGAAGVTITGRREDNLAEASERLGCKDRVMALAARSESESDAHQTVAATIERFGSVDLLVNNAGTNPSAGPLADVDLGAVAKTWAVNQLGPLLWARAAWSGYLREHGGCVINVASIGGMMPGRWLGAYNVSKAALIHLTRQLAMEMAPSVRVNAVAPSVVRTRLSASLWEGSERHTADAHPLKRIGEPADVAGAILFLGSDLASWISGITLPVDGGVSGATASPVLT